MSSLTYPLPLFCEEQGIKHELSCPRTPQQNGVVERKNRTLQEMARTMLSEYGLPPVSYTHLTLPTIYSV